MINAIASGEELSGAEIQDALVVLNQMMDAWSAQRLMIFTLARQLFALQAGKQTYTLGTGGDWNYPRPSEIPFWSCVSNQNPVQPLELAAPRLLTDAEWQAIPVKSTAGSLPTALYDDGGFPFRNLSVYPVPTDNTPQIALYMWTSLQQFADLNTDYTFPNGYLEAIKYNLAVRLAAEWPGTMLSQALTALAVSSMGVVKRANPQMDKLVCDVTSERGAGQAVYNWRIDQP